MSYWTRTGPYRLVVSAKFGVFALLLGLLGMADAEQPSAKDAGRRSSNGTFFIDCRGNRDSKRVLSAVALSEDATWHAYVEVTIDPGCLHTTRLWVAQANRAYRLVYLIPPKRDLTGNGMEILGWARNSTMLLAKTELWQDGSDAPDTQQVLAIDGATGMVYEPDLKATLQNREEKQCGFRVTDAGFGGDSNIVILVRAKFFTELEADETEADVPSAKRCGNTEETWSFNYATGEVKQVRNTEPFHLFKKAFIQNGQSK